MVKESDGEGKQVFRHLSQMGIGGRGGKYNTIF